jgi:hypothetical protein
LFVSTPWIAPIGGIVEVKSILQLYFGRKW